MTTINVEALTIDLGKLDLPDFEDIGRVVGIGYQHEPYGDFWNGLLVHFEVWFEADENGKVPPARVVELRPSGSRDELFRAFWKDTNAEATDLDEDARELCHLFYDAINAAFERKIHLAVGKAVSQALLNAKVHLGSTAA